VPEDEIPYDPIPALEAELEQLEVSIPRIAKIAKVWFDGFVAEGFEPRFAVYLTACELFQSPGKPT
jgi:hypothetical protein